jgi:hypothetical protein
MLTINNLTRHTLLFLYRISVCDIVVVENGSENLEWAAAFFEQVRQQPGLKKGMLRISL